MIAAALLIAIYGYIFWVWRGEQWFEWRMRHWKARREGYDSYWHKREIELQRDINELITQYNLCQHLINSQHRAKTRNSKTSTAAQHRGRNKSAR